MTRQEIIDRIETLKTQRMYLACKDRWNRDDYAYDDKMLAEMRALRKLVPDYTD